MRHHLDMASLPWIWGLAFLWLQGTFSEDLVEHISLVEGQNLDLHCVSHEGNSSVLEWKDPLGFVIFLGPWPGLRDGRYELLHSSPDALSIRLSNVTTRDEGVFTCFCYAETVGRKQVNVTVLAPPSQPSLEALKTARIPNKEENTMLRCSTTGSWPAPLITWLLGNMMEISGDTQHRLEAKKFSSTSILTVYKYPQGSVISCIVSHEGLGGRHLTATWHFKYTSSDEIVNITKGIVGILTATLSPEAATLKSDSTNDPEQNLNVTEENFRVPSISSEAASQNSEVTNEPNRIFWEGFSTTQTPLPRRNVTYKGFVKGEPNILFQTLVSILLLALFIVALFFVVKLWKAHGAWKKENDVSGQSVETNRNEGLCWAEKRGYAVPWKTDDKKRVIQGSSTRTPKNSEECQDSSVFEKQLSYIKETDL